MTKQEKQAKWEALGPALIQKPLRYIKNATAKTEVVDGKPLTVLSREFFVARDMADLGIGVYVTRVARAIHLGMAVGVFMQYCMEEL